MPRVHHCFAQHLNENRPPRKCAGSCSVNKRRCICKKCKCRKEVDIDEAHRLVDSGEAEWLVLKKHPVEFLVVCPICLNDDLLKKSCSNCNKIGTIIEIEMLPIRSNDIVMVTAGSGDPGRKVFRSVMSKQTPRVATIEQAHIVRAYVNGYQEDIDRIEAYGKTNKDFLNSLIVPFIPDPWEGRTLFTFGVEERTDTKARY